MVCSICCQIGHTKKNCNTTIFNTKTKTTTIKKAICPIDVLDGLMITKEKRHELHGKVSGGSGSKKPEDYQRQTIILGTGIDCNKTHMRIN